MKIKMPQSNDYSLPFRKNFHKIVEGVRAYSEKGKFYWEIDDETFKIKDPDELLPRFQDDIDLFKEEFSEIVDNQKDNKNPLKCNIADVYKLLDKKIDHDSQYIVEGEIASARKMLKNDLLRIELVGSAQGNPKITVMVNERTKFENFKGEDCEEGNLVEVSGKVSLYPQFGELQIWAKTIKLKDEPGYYEKQRKQWAAEIQSMGLREKRRIIFTSSMKNIAVISNKKGKGYGDFVKIINKKHFNLIPVLDVMSAENISRHIEELNTSSDVDCICIVRGGGAKYGMLSFNEPELFAAIHQSKIPVLTAIGHADDESFCASIADKNCLTPTDGAKFLNSLLYNDSMTPRELREKINELMEENKKLSNELNALKQEANNKGFFRSVADVFSDCSITPKTKF